MNCQEVILTSVETNKVTICESIREATKFLNCGQAEIIRAEKRGGTCHGYRVRYGKDRLRGNKETKTNICFDCQKACGGCSWSEYDPQKRGTRFEPVPGWTAEKVPLRTGTDQRGTRVIETYAITACPEFVPDEPRKVDYRQLSVKQNEAFVKNLESILRKWANG